MYLGAKLRKIDSLAERFEILRDISLTKEEESLLIKAVKKRLKEGKEIISAEEVFKMLKTLGIKSDITLIEIRSILCTYVPTGHKKPHFNVKSIRDIDFQIFK